MHFPYPCTFKKEAEYSIEIVSCHINKKKKNRKKEFFFFKGEHAQILESSRGLREDAQNSWRAIEDFGQGSGCHFNASSDDFFFL